MPLYESRANAINIINEPPAKWADLTLTGIPRAMDFLVQQMHDKPGTVLALDGWMGVDFQFLASEIEKSFGAPLEIISSSALYMHENGLQQYKKRYITDDPAFGWSNTGGGLPDLFVPGNVQQVINRITGAREKTCVVIHGPGAASEPIRKLADIVVYCDITQQQLLCKMWDGKIIPPGHDKVNINYSWKEYYYNDFYLLYKEKNRLLPAADYYLDCSEAAEAKLIPGPLLEEILEELVKYPVKEVKIFQPGPWGAYRYKDLFDVPGLGCNAWNELAGPELNILVDIGRNTIVNMPVTNLLQHADKFVGPLIAKTLPGMLPFDVWLNDGYFPDPVPQERSSMPIHNHPSTSYVKKNFNEPLGRYETYYIAEAYEGANTLMGFHEDADYEEWQQKCYESERTGDPVTDWKNYVKRWETNVGDLFLIPPGTTHGHGGNQMVLEMDTSASPCGTEYSFFMYDFCRPSWDDNKKSMTGKPLKMHNRHGFNVDECRREDWVKENLFIRQPGVVKWTKEYAIDRYPSYGPMPFEIERVHFTRRAEYSTLNRFMHIPTLTVGKRVLIRSRKDPSHAAEIDLWQACLIPACFEDYEVINLSEGACTLVLIRWKKG